jgi:hypothetical protein
LKYIIKVGDLYVNYISIKKKDRLDLIGEVLLRPLYAKKFTKEEAYIIAKKLNGEVIQKVK